MDKDNVRRQQQPQQQQQQADTDVTTEKKDDSEDSNMERKDNSGNDGKIRPEDVNSKNLKDYLVQEGFTRFDKLESDFNSGELTFKDIMRMDKSDLKQMLSDDYKVKVAQKNRFIDAITKIPASRAHPGGGM